MVLCPWPWLNSKALNASRGFVSISWASCLFYNCICHLSDGEMKLLKYFSVRNIVVLQLWGIQHKLLRYLHVYLYRSRLLILSNARAGSEVSHAGFCRERGKIWISTAAASHGLSASWAEAIPRKLYFIQQFHETVSAARPDDNRLNVLYMYTHIRDRIFRTHTILPPCELHASTPST